MKALYIIILYMQLALNASAQDGTWRVHASYHNAKKAVKAGDTRIYALADGSLFSYDTDDNMVLTYDKANALSDFGIKDIAYSSAARMLVVLFENGNVNLLDDNGNSWCLPELKNKALSDKTLNELKVEGAEAFICTNSGLAVIDMKAHYFSFFYDLGAKITNVAVGGGNIYAKTASGIFEGSRKKNLLDASQWTQLAAAPEGIVFGVTEAEKVEQAALMATVSEIDIDSPARNYAYKLNMVGERLLVAGGNFYYPEEEYPGMALKYEGGKWTQFDEEEPLALMTKNGYMNVTDVVQDPNDSEHHWLGTKRSGIYEFRDYKMVNHYTYDNSPITSILPNDRYAGWYTRVVALNIDPHGNLWMCNTECDTIVRILTPEGKWIAQYYPEIHGTPTYIHTKFDRRGWTWINSSRKVYDLKAGLLIIDTNGTIETQKDDQHAFISEFANQDGVTYAPINFNCMTEDLNGEMWIGTSDGLFISHNPEELMQGRKVLSQIKVPRNDGSNLADYLLNAAAVRCITIDGGNRKWIGTQDDGVYLVSPDGTETIHHFTADNSPLVSNFINDIAINGATGEVFIATYNGLCSYMSDAIDAAPTMSKSSLKVYPNPVRPEYTGNVRITGLMQNSNVKIVNAAGRLVKEGTSTGGMYSWNCRTAAGKYASPGIYYVLATDEDGNEGATAKILLVR